jgi:anti-repressor protein
MRDLELFDFAGQQMRVVDVDGQPWFVAADVARILGYRDAFNMARRLDDEDRGTRSASTPSGDQEVTVISEPGLYAAVLGSQIEGARAFKRWVTHDVLPAIRHTGSYRIPAQADPASIDRRALALMVIEAEDARDLAERQVAELEPKARMADTVMAADGDWSVREAAQVLNRSPGISTGQRRLFGTLRDLKWVDARGIPYQAQIENGRLSTRVRVYDHPHTGEPRLADPQVRITGKGLAALLEHLTKQHQAAL